MMIQTNGHSNPMKPAYGRRLLPAVIDDTARDEPDRVAFYIPLSSDPHDGWGAVTFADYARAINRCAHRIIEAVGHPPKGTTPAIAYIGPNDARYVVMAIAAIKTGYKTLFISTRNSQEGQLNLFELTHCQLIAYASPYRSAVASWLQEREGMRGVEVSSLDVWFPSADVEVPDYPYNKTFEEMEWQPAMTLHTSGSTGLPKPVDARHGMLAVSDRYHELEGWNGYDNFMRGIATQGDLFDPMPLFHAAGMYFFLFHVVYWHTPIVLGLGDRPLSSSLAAECIKHSTATAALLPPAILEEMSQDAEQRKILRDMNLVGFGGGNLAREAGNRLVEAGVKLGNFIGATEMAPYPMYYQTDPKLWQYFVFNTELFGADWRRNPAYASADEDVHQLVVVRQDKEPGFQGFFYTFPDANEYDTKDLFRPHPTLPNHWIYHARSDDVLVFSNGEKLNPTSIEGIVEDHPRVKGALVVGAQRFQPALIIEPAEGHVPQSEDGQKAFIEDVWPLIVTANKETVAHGQIGRDYIMISYPNKPFPRAGKGTKQRAAAVTLYEGEIDALYEKAGHVEVSEAPRLEVRSDEGLAESICRMFDDLLHVSDLEPDTDFFSAGIDSMKVIAASRLLRAGLAGEGYQVDSTTLATRAVYSNPTALRLARYLRHSVGLGDSPRTGRVTWDDTATQQQEAMEALLTKYTIDLPVSANPNCDEARTSNQVILLTGSTGMLGSYLLDALVSSPSVSRIVCLNRAPDGGIAQQAKAMSDRGLTPDYASKATFLHADLSRFDLGIPKDTYQSLLKDTDRIIHNAWPVNFNMPVESFQPHLRGVRNLCDFATAATRKVAFVFISSIGTAQGWNPNKHGDRVPEEKLTDWSLPFGGYGRSKMVASSILDEAARLGGFRGASIRVGQIAGPESQGAQGVWNRHEWLPSIVASSLYLGALPEHLGKSERVDWTPVERIAGLVMDVVGSKGGDPAEVSGYYHGVNPEATNWSELAPAVKAFYGDRIKELVSFKEWVKRLEESGQAVDEEQAVLASVEKNPGVKLLETYKGMAAGGEGSEIVFAMDRTIKKSEAMRTAKAVDGKLMKQWCEGWGFWKSKL